MALAEANTGEHMVDLSLYEQAHPSRQAGSNAYCLGRITAVDPTSRLCTVKTFFATSPSMHDRSIDSCQWLMLDANPDGDEAGSIPRAGSICMVFFIHGEAFAWGFLKALNSQAQAITGQEVSQLTEGDKIFSTVGGNYIKIGANGSIIIQSNQTLRTLYFPTGSLLSQLCETYNFENDGGTTTWGSDDEENCLWSTTYRRDLANSFQVLEENGNAGGLIMRRVAVGPGIGASSGVYVYEETVDVTGMRVVNIGPPGAVNVSYSIGPDGTISLSNGGGQAFQASILPTGDMELDIGPTVTISAKVDGTVSITAPAASVIISNAGEVTIQADNNITVQTDADLMFTCMGDLTVNAMGMCTVSGTMILLDGTGAGGAGAQFGVLTFPNVIDPLTGTPLGPGSTSVLASI